MKEPMQNLTHNSSKKNNAYQTTTILSNNYMPCQRQKTEKSRRGRPCVCRRVGRQSALQATLRQTQGLPLRVHVATFETPWQLDAFPLERLQWEHQQGFVREWKG